MNKLKNFLLPLFFSTSLVCPAYADTTVVADGNKLKDSEAVAALKLAKEAAQAAADTIDSVDKFEEAFVKYIENQPGRVDRISDAAKALGRAVFGTNIPSLRAAYIYEHSNQTGYAWGFQSIDHQDNFSTMCEKKRLGFCTWNWNDNASAIKTNGTTVFVGYDHANYGGDRIIIAPGESVDFSTVDMPGGNAWSDRLSSGIVMQGYDALVTAFP